MPSSARRPSCCTSTSAIHRTFPPRSPPAAGSRRFPSLRYRGAAPKNPAPNLISGNIFGIGPQLVFHLRSLSFRRNHDINNPGRVTIALIHLQTLSEEHLLQRSNHWKGLIVLRYEQHINVEIREHLKCALVCMLTLVNHERVAGYHAFPSVCPNWLNSQGRPRFY